MPKKWIAFLGADGAGKSTVIDAVITDLEEKGVVVEYHHWKPVKHAKQEPKEGVTVDDPHNQKPRSIFMSWLKACGLVVQWRLRFSTNIWRSLNAGKLVLFDRFYDDMLVDYKRYRYHGGAGFAKWVFKLMPKPCAVIYLDADADILLGRKDEVPREVLVGIVEEYRKYSASRDYVHQVNAMQAKEKVIADTLEIFKMTISR